jgi:hypothetical protein
MRATRVAGITDINRAKSTFVKWLKDNKAENIDIYEGEDGDESWDYYRCVSGFIGDNLYTVYFMVWEGDISISYSDEENSYSKMSIEEFLDLIS